MDTAAIKKKKITGITSLILALILFTGCVGVNVKAFEDKAESFGLGACAVIKVLDPGAQITAKLVFSFLGPHLDGVKIDPDGGGQASLSFNKIIDTIKAANPDLIANIEYWESFEAGIKAVSLNVQNEIENQNIVDALNFLKRFVGTVNGCVGMMVAKDGIKMADPCLAGHRV
jgi:hypothetical protein